MENGDSMLKDSSGSVWCSSAKSCPLNGLILRSTEHPASPMDSWMSCDSSYPNITPALDLRAPSMGTIIRGMSEISSPSDLKDSFSASSVSNSILTPSRKHCSPMVASIPSHQSGSSIPRVSASPTLNSPWTMLNPLSMRDTAYSDRSSLLVHLPFLMMRATDADLAYFCQSSSAPLLKMSIASMW